ncbi:4-hydroxy-tetrahydrodipicolinate reductase [Dokdonella sp.]|uniref:4-hydroxy-tetrahydrodipicolinate reductase n=1 Tax=Dokdonella sp. TaxID=2291710 RepID=UPI003C5E9764
MSEEFKKIRVAVSGAAGRMGQAVLRIVAESRDLEIAAALVRTSASAATASGSGLFATTLDRDVDANVLIDFSGAQGFDAALELAIERKLPLVCGSTGLAETQQIALTVAARSIPVLWASNFSLGVAVLAHLAAEAARLLPDWDCEIIEAHHRQKLDAPSGTALMLGQRINSARGRANEDPRIDRSGARDSNSIGYAVSRSGDIVGEHEVRLAGLGERLELIHRAGDRELFARGALAAARWIVDKPAGRHEMADVLGLNGH